jgi:multicomponent Na+:H+ antiporter subunit D
VLSYALGGWAGTLGHRVPARCTECARAAAHRWSRRSCCPSCRRSAAQEIDEDRQGGFYAAVLLLIAGLLGITATGDAFNVFVFLEISSLSTYTLIALGRDRRALTSAFRYLIMGTLGATFYLIGVGLLYGMTGTLNMADLGERLPAVADTRTVHTAVGFLVAGVCLKIALFPLAPVAAERLHLCAVGGQRADRGHLDQGGGVPADPFRLHRVRHRTSPSGELPLTWCCWCSRCSAC